MGKLQDIITLLYAKKEEVLNSVVNCLDSAEKSNKIPDNSELFKNIAPLMPFATAQDFSLALCVKNIYLDVEKIICEYEINKNIRINKTTLYLHIGILCFWSRNYDDSLYYIHKSIGEATSYQRDINKNKKNINRLFKVFFEKPISELINHEFEQFKDISEKLSDKKLNFLLLNNCKRSGTEFSSFTLMRICHSFILLQQKEINTASQSLYYLLIADLCTYFENELKAYLQINNIILRNTLGAIASQSLTNTQLGNLSNIYSALSRNTYPCHDTTAYNNIINNLLSDIESEQVREQLAIKLLHLVVITRNQVNHKIDESLILFQDISVAKKVFLIICIALPFPEYL